MGVYAATLSGSAHTAGHQQYRDRAMAQDVFRGATHDYAPNSAAAVRAAHDQVGMPSLRLLHDVRSRLAAHGFNQRAVNP